MIKNLNFLLDFQILALKKKLNFIKTSINSEIFDSFVRITYCDAYLILSSKNQRIIVVLIHVSLLLLLC